MDKVKNQKQNTSKAMVILVILACMLLVMLNNGVRSNFGLIASAVNSLTGLPETNISFAIATAQLLYGLSQPFFGIIALKKSNSFVLGVGSVLMAAGLFLVPFSKNVMKLYLSLGIMIGLAAGALAFGVIMGVALPTIGSRYAATASGIINGACGIGSAILAPYLQIMHDHGLFSESMVGLAVLSIIIALMCIWLGKNERRCSMDVEDEESSPTIREMLQSAVFSSQFMHLALAFFTCGFFMAINETFLYPQLISYGFEGSEVAFLFSIYGIMGMIGPVIAGLLCNKINPKVVLGTTYGLRPILIILFLMLPKTSMVVYCFVIGLGLTGNSTVPSTTLLLSKFYGNEKMPTLSGIAMVFHQVGSFASTWIGGILIASSGNYTLIWLCGAVLATIAAGLCYTIRDRAEL